MNLQDNKINVLAGVGIGITLIMILISPYFLTVYNFTQIIQFSSVLLLISAGQTFIVLAGKGGIDLSVGSVISLSSTVLAVLYGMQMPLFIAIVITLIIGIGIGIINAFFVSVVKIPPLIVTLSGMYTYGGLALILGTQINHVSFPDSFGWITRQTILAVPMHAALIVLPIIGLLLFVQNKTVLGRNIFLIGINDTAARYAGIKPNHIRFFLYVISALLATVGGIIMSAWLMTSKADVGRDMELQTIAVVMLGGTSILGGIGGLGGTIIAVFIVTILATGLQLAQINTIWQLGILGIILLGSIMFNQRIMTYQSKKK